MSATQTWFLRSALVLGMVVAVVTVLYFTPMPEHYFESCDRPCHELDWPMICRIKITLEQFETLSRFCGNCPQNVTECNQKYCILADGKKRSLFTANRELPGPSIHVCQNDILLVDVMNKVPGQEFSIHWRGQNQQGTPCMDGVPMVTQCPISSFTTFQYKFRVSSPGTHIWHAHSTSQRADGVFGSLIVRQSNLFEPQRKLYDTDEKNHSLMITEWNGGSPLSKTGVPATILLNGKVDPIIWIKEGRRHRFRMAYISGSTGCPLRFKIDEHYLKVIALDGFPVVPFEVKSVNFGRGERIDFVVKANQLSGSYKMSVESLCNGSIPVQTWISYKKDKKLKNRKLNMDNKINNEQTFRTDLCEKSHGQICLNDVQSLFAMPLYLKAEKVDKKLNFFIDNFITGHPYDDRKIARINNLSFSYPSSPLLTQYDDVSYTAICNQENMPENCENYICECVHVEHVALGSSVEITLINMDNEEEFIFHLHGYSFYVVGYTLFSETLTIDQIKKLDGKNLLIERKFRSPARKDTIRIPRNGAVVVRFVANNPGFWMLRDEHAKHWTRGLDVVLHVGSTRQMASPPSNFPKCGNWIGPEFFLA